MAHNLQVVLVEPEIPPNTGTIGRLCLGTGSTLHLVKPLGFDISDSSLKRAGLDYWEHLDVKTHESLEAFLEFMPKDAPKSFYTKKSGHTYFEHKYREGEFLIFGKETAGLPEKLINRNATESFRIPMVDARVRSINLACAVGVVVYEAIRQLEFSE